jgi:hypothetical protein
LRDYLDNISKSRKKRTKVYTGEEFASGKEAAPKTAPDWTKSGYNGSLKKFINRYMNSVDTENINIGGDYHDQENIKDNNNYDRENDEDNNDHDWKNDEDNNNHNQENVKHNKQKKRSKSVVSEEYNTSSSSSDK